MKTRKGRITIGLIIALMLAIGVTWTVTQQADAATVAARTIVIPNDSYTNAPWVIFYNAETGAMYHATTGAETATYSAADILSVVHSSNTGVYTIAVPALPELPRTGMLIFDTATPGTSVTPTAVTLYDQKWGTTHSDTNPLAGGRVRTLAR